jgi:predicted MFS family arabinose efflux permease
VRKFTFIILCLEGAVLSFNVAATAALVPSIAQSFALSQFIVGKIIWLYMLPYGLAALIYGPLVRAYDAKRIELVCIFCFGLSNILAASAQNIHVLFVARFLMGFFGASVIPLGLILIGKHIEGTKKGKFVGIFFSSTFVASLLGLFLSGLIHWRLIYWIPGIAALLLFAIIYFYLPSFKEEGSVFKFNYGAAFKNKRIAFIFTYIFLISLLYHGVQQWLAVYFSAKFNCGQFLISTLVTLTSLSGIFGEAWGGIMADSLGRVKTINLGIVLMILAVVALTVYPSSFLVLALLMIIWGLGWTFNHAGLSTMLTDLPKDFLNESASLNSSVRFVSGGLGTALGGLLMQKNLHLGFIVFGLSLILLRIFDRKLLNEATT